MDLNTVWNETNRSQATFEDQQLYEIYHTVVRTSKTRFGEIMEQLKEWPLEEIQKCINIVNFSPGYENGHDFDCEFEANEALRTLEVTEVQKCERFVENLWRASTKKKKSSFF